MVWDVESFKKINKLTDCESEASLLSKASVPGMIKGVEIEVQCSFLHVGFY
jgi:hypothetical protein